MPTLEQLTQAIEEGGIGFCLKCGAETSGVEPDARNYECEECGASEVFGAEEVLMMGACEEQPKFCECGREWGECATQHGGKEHWNA